MWDAKSRNHVQKWRQARIQDRLGWGPSRLPIKCHFCSGSSVGPQALQLCGPGVLVFRRRQAVVRCVSACVQAQPETERPG